MKNPITKTRAATLPIGEVSKRSGVNIETIRYYERLGLLPKPRRSANGRRVFEGEHLKRLTFIRRARALGFSQDEVRALLVLADGGAESCGEVRDLANVHLHSIREKIADLKKMERVLSDTVSRCKGADAPACPVLDALAGQEI
jgi:MerR family mercuric resistance operon transcriptional regulator